MARPGDYPLDLYHGDSYAWEFVLWDDPAKTITTDLTGVTAYAQLRNVPGGTLILDLTTSITLPNVIQVSIAAADWPPGTIITAGAWDLQLNYPDEEVITILAGKVTITKDVTVVP